MRRMSAIVLFAIALFLGTFTFASATTSTDPAANDPAANATSDSNPAQCDKPADNPSDGSGADSRGGSSSGDKCADNKNAGGDNKDSKGDNGNSSQGDNKDASFTDHGSSDLSLTSLTDQYKQIDVTPKGDSLGDSFVFSDKLYLDSGSHQAGTTDGVCVLTRLDKGKKSLSQQCVITFTLPKGQLTAQGVIRFSAATADDTFTIAVTGGTDSYDHAGGEAHVTFLSDTKTKIEIDLNR